MQIQYNLDDVRGLIQKYPVAEIPIDFSKLSEFTKPVECIAFGEKLKFEFIYFNNKFEYKYHNEDVIVQIYDKDTSFLDTCTDLQPFIDLLYYTKRHKGLYTNLVLMLLPITYKGLLKTTFNNPVEVLKDYRLYLFKVGE